MTKFTVIIPTRDRCDTLYYSLRTVTRQNYPNLEILVSDNVSSDRTPEVVRAVADSRIRYVNTSRRLSMAHHYEWALSHVSDGWVTILGDDDGLLPGALSAVNDTIQKSGCEAVSSRQCIYYWPEWKIGTNRSKLLVPIGDGCTIRSGKQWIRRLLEGYCYHDQLPILYTGGFASVDLINRGRASDGRFYRSMFPDVYSAIVLAWLAGRFAFMHRPAVVAGVSKHSTGGSQFGLSGYSQPFDRYYAEDNIPNHPTVAAGRIISLPIVYYECYLQSEHVHGDFLKVALPQQIALAACDADGRAEELRFARGVAERNGLDFDAIALNAGRIRDRYRRFIRRRTNGRARVTIEDAHGARDIAEAVLVSDAVLAERNRRHGSAREHDRS